MFKDFLDSVYHQLKEKQTINAKQVWFYPTDNAAISINDVGTDLKYLVMEASDYSTILAQLV